MPSPPWMNRCLPTPADTRPGDKDTVLVYPDTEPDTEVDTEADALSEAVDEFFGARKYRLESGEPGGGTYGVGNDILRVLFCAFHKHPAIRVVVDPHPEGGSTCTVTKAVTGGMGGVIGYK